jgi:MFS family permease
MLGGAGGFAIFSSTMSKTPVLPLFADELGASPELIGLIAAAATVVGILTSAPAGFLSDYIGRKKIILAAGLVFASAPFLYYWIQTPWQLGAVRLYHGLATAIFGPVALAMIADMFSSRRAEKMGWFSSATLIGRFLAPLLGGFLIFRYGFKTVYLFCGAFGIIAFLLLLRLPGASETSHSTRERLDRKRVFNDLGQLLSNVPLVATSLCEAVQYFAFGAVETFFPLYAIEKGMNASQVGILFSAQILAIAFTKPLMGRLSDKHGRKASIILGLVFGSVAVGCIPVATGFVMFGLILMAFGLAMAVVTASTAAMVADLSRGGAYGSSMGVLSSIMDVGHAAGPVVAGIVVAGWGYGVNFALVACITMAAAILFPVSLKLGAGPAQTSYGD